VIAAANRCFHGKTIPLGSRHDCAGSKPGSCVDKNREIPTGSVGSIALRGFRLLLSGRFLERVLCHAGYIGTWPHDRTKQLRTSLSRTGALSACCQPGRELEITGLCAYLILCDGTALQEDRQFNLKRACSCSPIGQQHLRCHSSQPFMER
jgi:hypothetical protein